MSGKQYAETRGWSGPASHHLLTNASSSSSTTTHLPVGSQFSNDDSLETGNYYNSSSNSSSSSLSNKDNYTLGHEFIGTSVQKAVQRRSVSTKAGNQLQKFVGDHCTPTKVKTQKLCLQVPIGLEGRINWAALFLTFMCEMLGIMFLIVLGAGTHAIVYTAAGGGGTGAFASVIASSFAFAFALTGLILTLGVFSGQGHFNPAITLLMRLFNHCSTWTMLAAIIGQLVGCFVGALVLLAIFENGPVFDLTTTVVDPYTIGVSTGSAIAVEIVGGTILLFSALRLAELQIGAVLTSLAMGFVMLCVQLFGTAFTGGSYNFFRTLGPAVLTGVYSPFVSGSWWIYPVASLGAIALAALLNWAMMALWNWKYTNAAMMVKKEKEASEK